MHKRLGVEEYLGKAKSSTQPASARALLLSKLDVLVDKPLDLPLLILCDVAVQGRRHPLPLVRLDHLVRNFLEDELEVVLGDFVALVRTCRGGGAGQRSVCVCVCVYICMAAPRYCGRGTRRG